MEPDPQALLQILRYASEHRYRFITPTPITHQRVLRNRGQHTGTTLRDVFGWNLPFTAEAFEPELIAAMDQAGILRCCGELFCSAIRISSIDDDLYLHSGYPTTAENAIFFGPDTYRFARFIRHALASGEASTPATAGAVATALRILDVGCGSGAGGIVAARHFAERQTPTALFMNDINPLALQYTAINAALAGVPTESVLGDALSAVKGNFDLIISNPPYLDDASERAYRHGGAGLGRALSVRIAQEALARLTPGGQLLLYTGVAIVDGIDPFQTELLPLLAAADCDWSYAEIDADVFGEELERAAYSHVDRIAAVGLIATRRRIK